MMEAQVSRWIRECGAGGCDDRMTLSFCMETKLVNSNSPKRQKFRGILYFCRKMKFYQ